MKSGDGRLRHGHTFQCNRRLHVLTCDVDKALFGWLVKSSASSSQLSRSTICVLLLLSTSMATNGN